MKKLTKLFIFMISFQLLAAQNAMAASDTKFNKMEMDQLHTALTEKCLETEGCDLSEIDLVTDNVELQLRNQDVDKEIKKGLKKKKTDIPSIIKNIQDAGVTVVRVTIKAGDKVITVLADQLEFIFEVPAVKAIVRAGGKALTIVVEGTYKGLKKVATFTVKTLKAFGVIKVLRISLRTLWNITVELAKGTVDVVEAIFTSKAMVLVFEGVEYVLTSKPVQILAETTAELVWTTLELSFEAVHVILKGAWYAVKYTYKGTLFILGLPVVLVKAIFD